MEILILEARKAYRKKVNNIGNINISNGGQMSSKKSIINSYDNYMY
jgi:hypothetical protein